MNSEELSKYFKGKQIDCISTDGRYGLILKCTDGSILTVVDDGCEGSHFRVTTAVTVVATINDNED